MLTKVRMCYIPRKDRDFIGEDPPCLIVRGPGGHPFFEVQGAKARRIRKAEGLPCREWVDGTVDIRGPGSEPEKRKKRKRG